MGRGSAPGRLGTGRHSGAPLAWGTWLTRTLPDDAEAGGGVQVAVIQFAIMMGATMGGVVLDESGPATGFARSAAILILAALLAVRASARSVLGGVLRKSRKVERRFRRGRRGSINAQKVRASSDVRFLVSATKTRPSAIGQSQSFRG
jgi:hypothetical protein